MVKNFLSGGLIILLGMGQSIIFGQGKSELVNKNKLIEIPSVIRSRMDLPVYNHQDIIKHDSYVKKNKMRKVGKELKNPKFWVLLAAIGGITAGVVLASTANSDTRALPVPFAAMGPLDKP